MRVSSFHAEHLHSHWPNGEKCLIRSSTSPPDRYGRRRGVGGVGKGARRPIKVSLLNIDQLVICDEGPIVRNVLSSAKKKKALSGLKDVRAEGKPLRVARSHEPFWLWSLIPLFILLCLFLPGQGTGARRETAVCLELGDCSRLPYWRQFWLSVRSSTAVWTDLKNAE